MSINTRLRKLEARRKPDEGSTPYGYALFYMTNDGVTVCYGDGGEQPATPALFWELLAELGEDALQVYDLREDGRYRLWRDIYYRTVVDEDGTRRTFYRVPQTSIVAYHDWLETDCPDGLELVTFEDWLNGAPIDALASDWRS